MPTSSFHCTLTTRPIQRPFNAGWLLTVLLSTFCGQQLMAADPPSLPGTRSDWNGFDRYDFEVDGKPVLVVAPKSPAEGRPWVWHGEFFGHKPAPDIALLQRGFHIVYMSVPDMLGCPEAVQHWNAFYQVLTEQYGLAKKVALVGLSRGGLYCYNWAAANPQQVACIYGDAPVCDFKSWPGGKGKGPGSPRDWTLVRERYGFRSDEEAAAYDKNPVDNLQPLAQAKVPLLHVYGDADEVVPWEENTGVVAQRYRQLGGDITLIAKPGVGHHPHGLDDSTPIVEFIVKHAACSASSAEEASSNGTSYEVTAPPQSLQLDPFYTKYVSASGYPVVASCKVNDYALKEAAYLINMMLAKRPDIRNAMVASGSRMVVIAHDEFTTDIPEYAQLQPKDFWDARARGLGGSETDPVCSCAEENVLGLAGDPYSTECILIHEFAHNIHLRGLTRVDPTFDERLQKTYDKAMAAGLWKGKYASMNHAEYFAEAVQSWFDNNRPPDNDHNHVNTRQELREYDPDLATLCEEVFGDTTLVYTKPDTRLRDHLAGFDPAQMPAFAWPERLEPTRQKIREDAAERNRKAETDREAADSSSDQ